MSARTSVGPLLLISKYLLSKGRAQHAQIATYMEYIQFTAAAINPCWDKLHVICNFLKSSHLNCISSAFTGRLYYTKDRISMLQHYLEHLKPPPLLPAVTWTKALSLSSPAPHCLISNFHRFATFLSQRQSSHWACVLINGKVAEAFFLRPLCL